MPQREESAVASTESQKGRREIMGNFARAAALGAVAATTKDRAALAEQQLDEEGVPIEAPAANQNGNRLAKLAAVPALAVGWVGFNIAGGGLDQLAFMSDEKERKAAGGKAKKRR